jgi:CAAX protease family protein
MVKQSNFPYRFFIVTFVWSWVLWTPLVLAGAGVLSIPREAFTPISLLGAFGPAVGAFFSIRTLDGKVALHQYLRSIFNLKFGWRAWLIPMLALGGIAWLAWILPEIWGTPRLPNLLPSIWMFPLNTIIMVFLGGGQEEVGWRGYILDPMEEKYGPWLGNLILGVVWGFWHLPLFFIPGLSQTYMPFAGFLLITIGSSWFLAWVHQSSGKKVLAAMVAHGWSNSFISLFPPLIMVEQTTQTRFWIWGGLTFLMGLITMFIRSRKMTK